MEITFADLAAISAQCEREIYARVVYEMLQQFTQGFFAGGFLVTRVTATQVSVAAGNGFYQDLTQVAPEPTMRPLYLAAASAQNITGPDASNPRWDIVCVRANRANTVSASRKYKAATTGDISTQTLVTETDWASDVLIVAGTPAGSPAAPATPAGYVKIATLVVTAVSGIAASGAITDQRTILPVGGTVQYNTLGFAKLTDDELRLIALWKMEGYTNGEIAGRLHCSPPTVGRRLRLIRNSGTTRYSRVPATGRRKTLPLEVASPA